MPLMEISIIHMGTRTPAVLKIKRLILNETDILFGYNCS